MATNRSGRRMITAAGGLGAALALREVLGRAREADLGGHVALVTGGSRGLGLAIARDLADQGARIAICARDDAELERARHDLASRGVEALAVRCNVSDREDVEQMVAAVRAEFGQIDMLICNAGVIQIGQVHSMEIDDFHQAMDVMYWGVLHPVLAVLPEMRERGAGRIGIVTSIGGKISVPYLLPYNAAKFAAIGLAEGLRAELADDGISVTTIVPGLMRNGSYLNAQFAGDAEGRAAAYRLFAPLSSLPGVTGAGEAAAHVYVRALRRGDAEVVYPPVYGLVARFHGLAPATTTRVMSWADRLLPNTGEPAGTEAGMEIEDRITPGPGWRALTILGRRAGKRLYARPGPVSVPDPD